MLGAWYLDVKYLVDLLDRFDLDFYEVMDSVECNFWANGKIDFNMIIYEVLSEIAYKFLEENPELSISNIDDFNVYCNYLDSHITFEDDEVQSKFEDYF